MILTYEQILTLGYIFRNDRPQSKISFEEDRETLFVKLSFPQWPDPQCSRPEGDDYGALVSFACPAQGDEVDIYVEKLLIEFSFKKVTGGFKFDGCLVNIEPHRGPLLHFLETLPRKSGE